MPPKKEVVEKVKRKVKRGTKALKYAVAQECPLTHTAALHLCRLTDKYGLQGDQTLPEDH